MKSKKEIEAEIMLRVRRQLELPTHPKNVRETVEIAFNSGMQTALEWVIE